MSPSLRSRRAKEKCMVKRKFESRTEAMAAAFALRKAGRLSARAYRCVGLWGESAHWHVTSGGTLR